MKTACVMGHFGFGHTLLNGQTIKTKIVAEELQNHLPGQVMTIDTHGGIKSLVKAPFHCFKALRGSRHVVILPAHKGLRVYAPLLGLLRPLFRGRQLHYAVIGGWLPSLLKSKKRLAGVLKRFDRIYVETQTMQRALEALGFRNIAIMPNCKELEILEPTALASDASEPYRLCTFSRVMREKGIEDAIAAVTEVNQHFGRTVFHLDIYGQVDAGQTDWFNQLQKDLPDYVTYGGAVPFDQSVEVLKAYFALLFPTRFYTEGIPGTIIDAYAAGVPVISTRWESFSDLVDDGSTGIGYTFGSVEELVDVLTACAKEPETILRMKADCLNKAREYLPSHAMRVLLDQMDTAEA